MVAQSVFSTGLISSYCTVEDVQKLLVGYDLSALGEAEAVAARVRELLPLTRQAVDTAVGHDFRPHSGEELILDGSGSDRLKLGEAGVVRLAEVREVAIGGSSVAPAAYAVYPRLGEIRLRGGGGPSAFPVGTQNVRVVADWGFPQPPGEVGLAQAKLTAAQVLAETGGEQGAVKSLRLGDYAVSYAPGGRQGAAIAALVEEAAGLLRPYRQMRVRVV